MPRLLYALFKREYIYSSDISSVRSGRKIPRKKAKVVRSESRSMSYEVMHPVMCVYVQRKQYIEKCSYILHHNYFQLKVW